MPYAMKLLSQETQGMGVDGRARLVDLVQQLRDSYTLVIIEHNMSFLFRLADRVSVIHWGQVIAEGTPDELKSNAWVRASALGQA